MYLDIEIYSKIYYYLLIKKHQDSMSINVLNNINIDDEIPIIVERNCSRVEEVESDINLYPVVCPSQFCLRIVMIPKTVIQ